MGAVYKSLPVRDTNTNHSLPQTEDLAMYQLLASFEMLASATDKVSKDFLHVVDNLLL